MNERRNLNLYDLTLFTLLIHSILNLKERLSMTETELEVNPQHSFSDPQD